MSLPFNLVLIRSWLGSLIRSFETRHGPRGANVSKDLLKHHCPEPRLLPCHLRVLISFPTVYPRKHGQLVKRNGVNYLLGLAHIKASNYPVDNKKKAGNVSNTNTHIKKQAPVKLIEKERHLPRT